MAKNTPFLFPCSQEGARGFYKGLLPNIIRTAPACGLMFVVYENCYKWLVMLSEAWGRSTRFNRSVISAFVVYVYFHSHNVYNSYELQTSYIPECVADDVNAIWRALTFGTGGNRKLSKIFCLMKKDRNTGMPNIRDQGKFDRNWHLKRVYPGFTHGSYWSSS